MQVSEPWKIMAIVAASLSGHRRDYPEAREAVESMIVNLPETELGMTEAETAEFAGWAHTDPEWEAAPRPAEVLEMLARARHASGECGSNDAEHESLIELTDFVAELFKVERP